MLYASCSGADLELTDEDLRAEVGKALEKIGDKRKVLLLPPDITRMHSRAGSITRMFWDSLGDSIKDIMPATGTHAGMTKDELATMFPGIPPTLFRIHDWRTDTVTRGSLSGQFMEELSEGKLSYPWPVQVNRLVASGKHDLIVSIGQVVPHEVVGMANYTKNILVGTGGAEAIDKSHYLGAVYGMERIMGEINTPVRRLFNTAAQQYLGDLPLLYVLTVVSRNANGELVCRGIFIGDDEECFTMAADLSQSVNILWLDSRLDKAVVYLEPNEYRSTWLGNKAIYRLRMAMGDKGELTILAPGIGRFGEDDGVDELIRKYGYKGTESTLLSVENNADLRSRLSAAAHLIHGSSEGRFRIRYCCGGLSRKEVEKAGFEYGDLGEMFKKYDPEKLTDGWNRLPDGERIFFVSNPAIGLWRTKPGK